MLDCQSDACSAGVRLIAGSIISDAPEKQAGQELDANTISRMQHFFRPIPAQPVFRVRR
jgi:hypothetical protein